ncbi:MAG: hypothetical protein ACKOE2_01065, partial [Actinomycetales bacterium]
MFPIIAPDQVAGLSWWPPMLVIAALLAINVVNNRLAPPSHRHCPIVRHAPSVPVLILHGDQDGIVPIDMS